MRLWRLASDRRAHDFTGGYGLYHSGRWNSAGHPVTYCATVPSLAALEKCVHVSDPILLPPLVMVEYAVPDDLPPGIVDLESLPADWMLWEAATQKLGDQWLNRGAELLLLVPSVVMPLPGVPDRNVLINHRHPGVARMQTVRSVPFRLDARLFR